MADDVPKRVRKRAVAVDDGVDLRFRRWYAEYPRKVAPALARAAYAKALRAADPDPNRAELILLEGLRRFKFDVRERFRPHPSSWLNAQRWLDEPDDDFDPTLRAAGLRPEDFGR